MSANADLITVETYVQQGENNLKTIFFIYGPKCKKKLYFGGPEGVFNDQTKPILLFQLSSHPYLCTCEIRKQSDRTFLSLNPKYEKIILFLIFGGSWGGLTSNPGERKFQGSKTS